MSGTGWLDAREARAWRGFISTQAQVRARLARQLQRECGLSEADYEVLVHLSEEPSGRLRAFQLGHATLWEKSRLSHHLSRMADRGLVRREACPTDPRGAVIVLTDAGREAITAAAPLHVAQVRRCFVNALSEKQLDALVDIADTVLEVLNRDGCAGSCAELDGPADQ